MDWNTVRLAQQDSQRIRADSRKNFSSPYDDEIQKQLQQRGMLQAAFDKQTAVPKDIEFKNPTAAITDWSGFEFDSPLTKETKRQEKQFADQQEFAIQQTKEAQAFQTKERLASQEFQEIQNAINRASGGGGVCFITTATVDALGVQDGEIILNEFRDFRDEWLAFQPEGEIIIARYYEIAPQIVEAVSDLKSVYGVIWEKYLKPCRDFIHAKNNDAAFLLYREMCLTLESKFL